MISYLCYRCFKTNGKLQKLTGIVRVYVAITKKTMIDLLTQTELESETHKPEIVDNDMDCLNTHYNKPGERDKSD